MKVFDLPSELFSWYLMNTSSGHDVFSYESCFHAYLAIAEQDGYLWRTYDRRLAPLINAIKFKNTQRDLEVGCGFGHDLIWTALVEGACRWNRCKLSVCRYCQANPSRSRKAHWTFNRCGHPSLQFAGHANGRTV